MNGAWAVLYRRRPIHVIQLSLNLVFHVCLLSILIECITERPFLLISMSLIILLAHPVLPLSSLQSTLTKRMDCLRSCCRRVRCTICKCSWGAFELLPAHSECFIWCVFSLGDFPESAVCVRLNIFHFFPGNENSHHILLSREPSSLNMRLAGKPFMRWRNSKGNTWIRTSERPKRSWRLSWSLLNMNINSC